MMTIKLRHILAISVMFLTACSRSDQVQISSETCIAEYIKAVHSSDIAAIRRLTSAAGQLSDNVEEKELRLLQKITPVTFIPTNTITGSTNVSIEGTATYRDDWNTNACATFQLILEDNKWKYDAHIINVDDGVDPMAE